MGVATLLRSNSRMALEVPRWALAFYRHHLPLVLSISSVPAAERFVTVLWGEDVPAAARPVLEALTLAARLLLVAVVALLVVLGDDRLRRLRARDAWASVKAFLLGWWPSLVVQWLLLAAAVVVFDLVPEQVVPRWVPDRVEAAYLAVLLLVKNLTVIAVTMLWWVGAVRQMLLHASGGARVDALSPS
jgi:hypothetical protein